MTLLRRIFLSAFDFAEHADLLKFSGFLCFKPDASIRMSLFSLYTSQEIEEPWLDDFSNLYLQDNDTPRYGRMSYSGLR